MSRLFTRVLQQRPLTTFLFFLCLFSGCTYALDVHSHRLTATLAQFVVWCPGAAASENAVLRGWSRQSLRARSHRPSGLIPTFLELR
jgi:hypothetical protein